MSVSQQDFDRALNTMAEIEQRDPFYWMAINLIQNGFESEGLLLILATWNFAGFRYILRDFDIGLFKAVIQDAKNALGRNLLWDWENNNGITLFDAWDSGDGPQRIARAFDILATEPVTQTTNRGLGPTGAAKVIHFFNPNLFVMWDRYMRQHADRVLGICDVHGRPKRYEKSGKTSGNLYVEFLRDMRATFQGLRFPKSKPIGKAIDEYNYVNITLRLMQK